MVRYTVTCCKCKGVRRYEGNTLGACMDQASSDGWVPTGRFTERMCRRCRKNLPDVE
jgi:hypothetical protein